MPERRDGRVSITHIATDKTGAQFVRATIHTRNSIASKDLRVPDSAVFKLDGIEVSSPTGEIRHPDGTRSHIISWHEIIYGGSVPERKLMKASGITSVGTNGQNGNGRR